MAITHIPSIISLLIIFANFVPHIAENKPKLVFILGDSTADVGTNNYLHLSKATANFPHNGIDFPNSQPTGRFSNGFNSADSLAKLFGLKKSPPPFLYLLKLGSRFQDLLYRGVNFASGGAGLLDITGKNLTVVPLSEQIAQFSSVRDNFTAMIGPAETEKLLSKSLFLRWFHLGVLLPEFVQTWSKKIRDHKRATSRLLPISATCPKGR